MAPWQSGGALEAQCVLRDHVALLTHSQIGGSEGKYQPAMAGTGSCVTAPLCSVQDFLNWGEAAAGWEIPDRGDPTLCPG